MDVPGSHHKACSQSVPSDLNTVSASITTCIWSYIPCKIASDALDKNSMGSSLRPKHHAAVQADLHLCIACCSFYAFISRSDLAGFQLIGSYALASLGLQICQSRSCLCTLGPKASTVYVLKHATSDMEFPFARRRFKP